MQRRSYGEPKDLLLVRIWLLPEHIARDVHRGLCLYRAVTFDGALAGETHFVLVAQMLEDVQHVQAHLFNNARRTQILLALLDEHAAGGAHAVAHAVEAGVLEDPRMHLDAGLAGFVT